MIGLSLSITEMMEMQHELQEKYAGKWSPTIPRYGRDRLLWGVGEIGEVIDIIKKHGDDSIAPGGEMREDFGKEMTDVFMYLIDVLQCYGFSAEEFWRIYAAKHAHNMKRIYVGTQYSEEELRNGEEAHD